MYRKKLMRACLTGLMVVTVATANVAPVFAAEAPAGTETTTSKTSVVKAQFVDAAGTEGRDPVDDIHKINAELAAYNPEIAERPQVIAANKTDLIYDPEDDPVQRLKDEFEPKGIKVFPISGATGKGISARLA